MRLALARELVSSISNLHFGPEVGVRGYKTDVPAVVAWRGRVEIMADDLERAPELPVAESRITLADARSMTPWPGLHSTCALTSFSGRTPGFSAIKRSSAMQRASMGAAGRRYCGIA